MCHGQGLLKKAAATDAAAQVAELSDRYRGGFDFALEKTADQTGNFLPVSFQCKVSGIDKVILKILQVPFVRLGTGSWKDLVLFPPDYQGRRLLRT